MKIIFLDIDGVLNKMEPAPDFEPECVAAFNHIVEMVPGVQVVISSSWRYLVHQGHYTVYGFAHMLSTHGLHGKLIDVTRPDISRLDDRESETEPRWRQIADWLKGKQVASYVVLDDDPGAFGHHPFVRIGSRVGLTMQAAQLAIEVLDEKQPT